MAARWRPSSFPPPAPSGCPRPPSGSRGSPPRSARADPPAPTPPARAAPRPDAPPSWEVDIIDATGCLTEITDPTQVPAGEAPILQGMLAQYRGSPVLQRLEGAFVCLSIAHCTKGGGEVPVPGTGRFVQAPADHRGALHLPQHRAHQRRRLHPARRRGDRHLTGFSPRRLRRRGGQGGRRADPHGADQSGRLHLQLRHGGAATAASRSPPSPPTISPSRVTSPSPATPTSVFVKSGINRYSDIHGYVQLTSLLGGARASDGHLRTDNTNGLKLHSFSGKIPNLTWGDIGLTDGEFDFVAPGDWLFYGNLGDRRIHRQPQAGHRAPGQRHRLPTTTRSTTPGRRSTSATPRPRSSPGSTSTPSGSASRSTPPCCGGRSPSMRSTWPRSAATSCSPFPSHNAPFTARAIDLPGAPAAIVNQQYQYGPFIGLGRQGEDQHPPHRLRAGGQWLLPL